MDTTGARAGRASRRRDVSMLRTERVHVIQPVAFLLPAEHVHGGADEGRGLAVALSRHVARDAELGPAEAVVSSCRRRYGTRVLELSRVVIRSSKLRWWRDRRLL